MPDLVSQDGSSCARNGVYLSRLGCVLALAAYPLPLHDARYRGTKV
jgi:hypothetical protein